MPFSRPTLIGFSLSLAIVILASLSARYYHDRTLIADVHGQTQSQDYLVR